MKMRMNSPITAPTTYQEHKVLVASDEVYHQLMYDGVEHVSIASLPGMWDQTVLFFFLDF